jgi:hypothetical protein
MRRLLMTASLAALTLNLTPVEARAEMEVAPAVTVKWNGFAQAWETLGENANSVAKGPSYNQNGAMLKRLRFKMTAEAYDGLSLVMLPEVAGSTGFQLLDGYIQADLDKYLIDFGWPITVIAGQFKTPFGLNRMYTPPQLLFVNYSSISNNVFGSNNFWDDGLMLTWRQPKLFKLDLAVVDGQGPNLATTTNYIQTNGNQDAVARLDLQFIDGLSFGGSVYQGEHFRVLGTGTPLFTSTGPSIVAEGPGGVTVTSKVTGPRLITGGFLQFKTFGKGLQVDLECINRGVERGGFAGAVGYYLWDSLQLALGYDRVEVYGNDAAARTRYQAGLNWFPSGPLRISLDQEASAAGTDQSLRPGGAAETILQGQVTF